MKSLFLLTVTLVLLTAFAASAENKHHLNTNVIVEIDDDNSHVCHMENVYHLTKTLTGGSRASHKSLLWNNFTKAVQKAPSFRWGMQRT